MKMSSPEPRFLTQEAKCGVRLNLTLFPIDLRELRRALAKNGYELSSMGRLPSHPTRLGFSGEIARKTETSVIAESALGEIGVVGRSLGDVQTSFEELVEIVNSELRVNLYDNVRYYWYIIHYKVDTGKLPHRQIDKTANEEYMRKFGRILGRDLSSLSVRLVPKNAIANQDSWLDVTIEPDVINGKFYHVGVVFRDPDKGKAETFVKDIEDNLLALIGTIEA